MDENPHETSEVKPSSSVGAGCSRLLNQTCRSIGCAAVFGVPVFFFFVALLLATDLPASEMPHPNHILGRVILALMTAVCISLAVFLCLVWDNTRDSSDHRRVRRRLLTRPDVTDEDFVSQLSEFDPELLLRIRQGVANIYGVPALKIHPADRLDDALRFHRLGPGTWSYLLRIVLAGKEIPPQVVAFGSTDAEDIAGLAAEARRLLDQLNADTDSD